MAAIFIFNTAACYHSDGNIASCNMAMGIQRRVTMNMGTGSNF